MKVLICFIVAISSASAGLLQSHGHTSSLYNQGTLFTSDLSGLGLDCFTGYGHGGQHGHGVLNYGASAHQQLPQFQVFQNGLQHLSGLTGGLQQVQVLKYPDSTFSSVAPVTSVAFSPLTSAYSALSGHYGTLPGLYGTAPAHHGTAKLFQQELQTPFHGFQTLRILPSVITAAPQPVVQTVRILQEPHLKGVPSAGEVKTIKIVQEAKTAPVKNFQTFRVVKELAPTSVKGVQTIIVHEKIPSQHVKTIKIVQEPAHHEQRHEQHHEQTHEHHEHHVKDEQPAQHHEHPVPLPIRRPVQPVHPPHPAPGPVPAPVLPSSDTTAPNVPEHDLPTSGFGSHGYRYNGPNRFLGSNKY